MQKVLPHAKDNRSNNMLVVLSVPAPKACEQVLGDIVSFSNYKFSKFGINQFGVYHWSVAVFIKAQSHLQLGPSSQVS